MAILQIIKYPDRILKQKTNEVRSITAETKKLINNIIDTMKAHNGIGLAASQVGVPLRIIVVLMPTNESKKISEVALINPKIFEKRRREKTYEEEGCLSFPGLYLKIRRANFVKVKAMTARGKIIEISAEGLLSRVLQHEIDHLDGKIFIDRLSLFNRLKIEREIKRRIKKGLW